MITINNAVDIAYLRDLLNDAVEKDKAVHFFTGNDFFGDYLKVKVGEGMWTVGLR